MTTLENIACRWAILAVFAYTLLINCWERPDGLKIASFFIGTILCTSLFSRSIRSTELRVSNVSLDDAAKQILRDLEGQEIAIVAHRPGGTDYNFKELEARRTHRITEPMIFLEIYRGDASEFTEDLHVRGIVKGGYRVFQCESPAVPNAIAALLLHLRDSTGKLPHVYFGWTEGHPISYVLKYIFFGEGETEVGYAEVAEDVAFAGNLVLLLGNSVGSDIQFELVF